MAPNGLRTWVEISAGALTNNLTALKATLDPGVKLCAIVKANAYGHGLREMVDLALRQGVDLFGVDSVDEALIIRSLSVDATIFIMGMTVAERLPEVIKLRAIQTVYDVESVKAVHEAAKIVGSPAFITLELETGLHRLGAEGRGLADVLDLLRHMSETVTLISLASHLSSAEDVKQTPETIKQYKTFEELKREVQAHGFTPEHNHIACSAAAILHELPHGTCIRFGLLLYGLWPSTDSRRAGTLGKRHADLKPVLTWKTRVAQVKDIAPGGGIGYGSSVVVNRLTRIAVLPVGYYDGFDRKLSNLGSVIIHGTRCPIIGRICMNMCMVNVSTVPGVITKETEVTLIGRDGMHTITADDLAEQIGTINYEVVTRINPLIPRIVI